MKQVADGLWVLKGLPRNAINVYLAGEVLIDSGTRFDARSILRQLRGRDVSAHALTHAHPDHQGSSAAVCAALAIPLWAGSADAGAVEDGTCIRSNLPNLPLGELWDRTLCGPAHPVERGLREGDSVDGFTVIDSPGHTHGHIGLWRESDRALIAGDVLLGMNPLTLAPGPYKHVDAFHANLRQNQESITKLAALEPNLVCFGHGPPLRNAAEPLAAFAQEYGA